jgi:hypothetical protein
MSLKIIQKNIKAITTNAAKLNVMIHDTAVLIAEHALAHGDCTPAQGLVNAMPASMRRTMLVMWFDKFTPIVVKADNPAWNSKMHKEGSKLFVPFDIEAGRATPFYELAEQNPEGKTLDFAALVKMVEAIGKRIEKKIEEGAVAPEDVASAKAIAVKVNALKFDRVAANDAAEPAKLTNAG